MIAYIEGKVVELTPTSVVLGCPSGIGYDINITLASYTQLQSMTEARLWITEVIREDAHELYGFLAAEERMFFGKLTSVSGVGPSTARLILSSYSPIELASFIENGEVERIKMVKGIGLKTAQRIIVDLKGKINLESADGEPMVSAGGNDSASMAEATQALKMLGFAESNIKKVLKKLVAEEAALSVEELIKRSLKLL